MMPKPVRTVQRLVALRTRLIPSVQRWLSRHTLAAILLLGLIEGLACLVAVPAWWHYDEPGHFEYVWLAAHSPTWPVQGQYDQPMRKEMAASMISTGWYRIRNIKVDLNSSEPIPIGVTQVGDQPGYYFLASLPLRLMPNASIAAQYYAARFISLLLYLLIIVIVWYALGEFLPDDHPLRWMSTVFVALLPAFADTMISVNNDVSAVLAASLFLWAGLRLIQKGYSLRTILFLCISLAVCYLSKSTAWFAFLLTPFVLVLALVRARFALLMWSAVAAAVIVLAVVTLQWGGPKDWYQGSASNDAGRIPAKGAPLGDYVFQFRNAAANSTQFLQFMAPDQVKSFRGKTATLGAWIWATENTEAGPLLVSFIRQSGDIVDSPQDPTHLTTVPAFHAITFNVPSDAIGAIVYVKQSGTALDNNNIFLDGLVLVPGEFDGSTPHFADADGIRGDWHGEKFKNLLRNASAEQGSFQLRKWVDDRTVNFLTRVGINLSLIITTVQDWGGTGWYYQDSAATLFRTFWASLAGDKAFLPSPYIGYFLSLLTVAGFVGTGSWLWKQRRNLRWDLLGFLGLALLLPWLLAVTRGTIGLLGGDPEAPWARYAYPAILPTAVLLCAGWLEWMDIVPAALKLTWPTKRAIFLGVIGGISVFALLNALQVFHPGWWLKWGSLAMFFIFQYLIFHFATKWLPGSGTPG